jgi:hypothetical protein
VAASAALIIDEGDLPALVACALQGRAGRLLVYHPRGSDPASPRRESAARSHAEALDAAEFIAEPCFGTADDLWRETCAVVGAAAAACAAGCSRVVWPRQVGPDPRPVAHAAERAALVGALAQVGCAPGAPERLVVELPVVDLTDGQLAELAEELGAPMRAFWPCSGGGGGGRAGGRPCGRCDGCERWSRAFREAGVPWPWAEHAAAV